MFGVGNYGVNVLMRALQTHAFAVHWFDRRKELTLAIIRADEVRGYILNVASASFGAFGARHWICVLRGEGGHWWTIDSDNKKGAQLMPDVSSTKQLRAAFVLPVCDCRSICLALFVALACRWPDFAPSIE